VLYYLYDLQHAMLTPARLAAEALNQALSHPLVPAAYTRMGRTIAAGSEIFERATRRYGKPGFGLPTATAPDGETMAVHEEIVARRPFCRLLRFRRETARRDPKVLIVAPMSGHYATLLRDTVAALLPEHDVHITDWVNANQVPIARGGFDLDDYVDYVTFFLERIGPGAHVIAVCQPSVPVMAAVSLMSDEGHPAAPASMTLMGGPIDTRMSPTKPNKLAMTRSMTWFEKSVIHEVPPTYPGFLRRVYPGFLQLSGFMSMNLDRHVSASMKHFQHLVKGDGEGADKHRDFYDEYLAVMDLPAEFFLQTIRTAFQEHLLPRGLWLSRNRRVDPKAIDRTALMTVEGELDDISGPGQTRAAHGLCHNLPAEMHKHFFAMGVGHYGIFNGRKWRATIMPEVRAFIRAHDPAGGGAAPAPAPERELVSA
jgi:poly(3-hydroxybutyrate) depolymerase